MSEMDVLEPLEIQVGNLLLRRGWKLAVAESCTGGLVCDRITNIPGSSEYFAGGVVAYAYEAKVRLLGVSWDTLQAFGAVSQETVLEMARGVRQALESEVGIAVSGIAGPGGATEDKPVGLTWIGLSAPGAERAWRFVWDGDRVRNKALSAQAALQSLADFLREDG
jgi:PncC family amidohydrolase